MLRKSSNLIGQSLNSSGFMITNSDIPQEITSDELIQSQIKDLYIRLNNSIDNVNKQVQHVIEKNQSQFLLAYRNHLNKINKQLSEIKKKSEQQQKMFSANDRIKYLQKQVDVFREEAIQLYDKLQKAAEEATHYRQKYQDIARQYFHVERDNKESLNMAKVSNSQKNGLELQIIELQKRLQQKQKHIQKLENQNKKIKERMNTSRIGLSPKFASMKSQTSKNRHQGDQSLRYSSIGKNNNKSKPLNNEFAEYFIECVNTVKRQIVFRKSIDKLDLSKINKLQDFRKIDKIHVISLFLKNPELQSWMYQKLFPNKSLNQIDVQQKYEGNSLESQYEPNAEMTQTQRAKPAKFNKFSHTKIGFRLPKMVQNNRTKISFERNSFYQC